MRILLLTDCYLPSTKSVAEMVHDLAVEFQRQGHEVIVAVPDHTLVAPSEAAVEDGVTVLRIRTGRIKGASKVIRAINEVRLSPVFWRSGKRFFRVNRCDLIIFYSPSIFFGRLVERLKKLWNCKAYLILRDIFPENLVEMGHLKKNSLLYRFFRTKELYQYSVADVIGVESPGNLRYFSGNGIEGKSRVEVLYNWSVVSGKRVVFEDDRERLGLKNKVVFIFGGAMGLAQDMDTIIRSAASVRDHHNIHFLFVGSGSKVLSLKDKIQRTSLNNVTLHPSVQQDKYLGLLSQFDVGLVSLVPEIRMHNIPGKILGYMYCSMPILATVNHGNDLVQILEESKAGFACVAGEDSRLRDYILRLVGDKKLRFEMGRNARALLEKTFSVSRAVSQILAHEEDSIV